MTEGLSTPSPLNWVAQTSVFCHRDNVADSPGGIMGSGRSWGDGHYDSIFSRVIILSGPLRVSFYKLLAWMRGSEMEIILD